MRLGVFARFGRSSSTAAPDRAQHAGQTDATAIFDEHRPKLLQEGQTDDVGTHHILDSTPQERQQPAGGAFAKMAVQPLLLDADPQTPSKARERAGTGLRLLPPAQHQDEGHLHKCQLALAQASGSGQFDAIVLKELFHHATHAWYTRHWLTPLRRESKQIFLSIFSQESFVVTWVLNSTILNLTSMPLKSAAPTTRDWK